MLAVSAELPSTRPEVVLVLSERRASLLILLSHMTFTQSYAGGSVGGAVKLNHGNADLVINWSGGLHHAKKAEVRLLQAIQCTRHQQRLELISNLAPCLTVCPHFVLVCIVAG